MRSVTAILVAFSMLLIGGSSMAQQETEKDIVDRYLKRVEKKHTRHLSWMSGSFMLNRINRSNDYNRFADYTSSHIADGELAGLGEAKTFALDLGIVFKERFSWSVGGEYWLALGQSKSGSFDYSPPSGVPTTLTDLTSEIQVWGITTGLQYYFLNHPTVTEQLQSLALSFGGGAGYYMASWEVWSEYQNLNLSTSMPEGDNIDFKATAPGYWVSLKAEYPLRWQGLVLGGDISYLYLNFGNVAWYNSADEEIVATYDGTREGRVDLGLSGVRGRIEIKRFFSW